MCRVELEDIRGAKDALNKLSINENCAIPLRALANAIIACKQGDKSAKDLLTEARTELVGKDLALLSLQIHEAIWQNKQGLDVSDYLRNIMRQSEELKLPLVTLSAEGVLIRIDNSPAVLEIAKNG